MYSHASKDNKKIIPQSYRLFGHHCPTVFLLAYSQVDALCYCNSKELYYNESAFAGNEDKLG